jgi:hypothetical protein
MLDAMHQHIPAYQPSAHPNANHATDLLIFPKALHCTESPALVCLFGVPLCPGDLTRTSWAKQASAQGFIACVNALLYLQG